MTCVADKTEEQTEPEMGRGIGTPYPEPFYSIISTILIW